MRSGSSGKCVYFDVMSWEKERQSNRQIGRKEGLVNQLPRGQTRISRYACMYKTPSCGKLVTLEET